MFHTDVIDVIDLIKKLKKSYAVVINVSIAIEKLKNVLD